MKRINLVEDIEKSYLKWFILIIVLNVCLKFWGIWNVTSSDEYVEVIEALRVCSGNLNYERWIKRVYLYILALEYGIYYIFQLLIGNVGSTYDFATRIIRNLEPLLIIARFTSAIFGILTVWVTYKIGKQIHSRLCGLIACAFLTVTPIVIEMSHYARVDATLGFLIICGIFFIIRIHQEKGSNMKNVILSGLFTALAFQCKTQGIILVVPFVVAYYSHKALKKSIGNLLLSKKLGFYFIGFIAGLIIGNPAILLAFPEYIKSVLLMGKVYSEPINITSSDCIGYIAYFRGFVKQMGFPIFLLITLSIAHALIWNRKMEKMIIISFIFSFYLVLGGSRYMVSSSYMLPIYPFLFLIASSTLIDITALLSLKPYVKWFAIVSILFALLIEPTVKSVKYELSISGPNTRILAKRWIEENIPSNSHIIMDSGKNLNTFAPLLLKMKILFADC